MNFGESLAYWYLRLNGFIPMSNFVLHRPELPNGYNADSDILAVRFPYVFEEIGGQEADWDNERFDAWDLEHRGRTVCLICEVKTGEYSKSDVNRAFSLQRLRYSVRRLGRFPTDEAENVSNELDRAALVKRDGVTVAKLLMATARERPSARSEGGLIMTPCLEIDLEDAVAFIRQRMRKYRQAKNAARMFFPGDLIQFLAWSERVPMVAQDAQAE